MLQNGIPIIATIALQDNRVMSFQTFQVCKIGEKLAAIDDVPVGSQELVWHHHSLEGRGQVFCVEMTWNDPSANLRPCMQVKKIVTCSYCYCKRCTIN